MAIAAGAILGAFNFGGAVGYLFGASMLSSVIGGALVGYSFGLSAEKTSSPTYSMNAVQNTKTQKLPIPIIYGKCRVAGNVFYERFHDQTCQVVDRYIGISCGPIQSITEVKIDDNLISGLKGCSLNSYCNSDSTTKDSRDPTTGPRPYPNKLAFIAMTLKASQEVSGSSVVTSIVEGKIVKRGAISAYSRNPAWIIRDLLTDTEYGIGISESMIDDTSFSAAADYYDELVEGEPRYTCDFCIDTQRQAVDHISDILSACRSFLLTRDKVQLLVDRPVDTYYKAVGMDQIVEGSFSWWQSADDDVINRAIIEWVDPNNSYEQCVSIFEDTADIAARGIREETYSMPSITRAAQAARMGAYVIDGSQGIRNYCSFKVSLKDADIDVWDVIAVTHDLPGWTNKWMRVLSVSDENSSTDDITITCAEYVEEVYNDNAMDIVAHIDTYLTTPFVAPDVTSFAVYIVNGNTNFAWTPVRQTFNNVSGYEIRMGDSWDIGELIITVEGNTTSKAVTTGLVSRKAATFWISAIAKGQYSANPRSAQMSTPDISQWDIVNSYEDYQEDGVLSGEIFIALDGTLWIQQSGPALSEIESKTLAEIGENALILQPAAGAGSITGEIIDLGKTATVNISADYVWQNTPDRNTLLMRRSSFDNTTWGDWEASFGSVTGRYLQIRIVFPAENTKAAALKGMTLYVDVPEQTLRFHGVAIESANGITITFSPPFVTTPAVVATSNNLSLIPIVSDVSADTCKVRLETVDSVASTGTVEVIAHGF